MKCCLYFHFWKSFFPRFHVVAFYLYLKMFVNGHTDYLVINSFIFCLKMFISLSIYFFNFLFLQFFGHTMAYEAPGLGIRSNPQLQPMPQMQQHSLSPTVPGQGSTLHPNTPEMLPIPLYHSGNPHFQFLKEIFVSYTILI